MMLDWPRSRAVALFVVTALVVLGVPLGQALAPVPLQLFLLNGNFDRGDMGWTVRGNARIENGKAAMGESILVAPCLDQKIRVDETGGIRTSVPIPASLFTKLKYDLRFRAAAGYTGDYLEVRAITDGNIVTVLDIHPLRAINSTCPWIRLPRTVAVPPVVGLTYDIDFRFIENGDLGRATLELDNIVLS